MRFERDSDFSVEKCEANPRKLYIFGDNLGRKGKGGQACIRGCKNSFGIATKYAPTTGLADSFDYFDDFDDMWHVQKDFEKLFIKLLKTSEYDVCVFPVAGIGTGRAKLAEKAPSILSYISNIIKELCDDC